MKGLSRPSSASSRSSSIGASLRLGGAVMTVLGVLDSSVTGRSLLSRVGNGNPSQLVTTGDSFMDSALQEIVMLLKLIYRLGRPDNYLF